MHVELQMDLALLQRAMKAETEAALLRAALDAETARWEEALRLTWQMVDPLKPAGQPGSYWRGQDAGIVAALTTLRANLKPPNVAGNRLARQGQSELTGLLGPGSEAKNIC